MECAVWVGHADVVEGGAGCHTLDGVPVVNCFRLWRPDVDG